FPPSSFLSLLLLTTPTLVPYPSLFRSHRAGSGAQVVWCFGSSLSTLLLLFPHLTRHQLSSKGLELLQTLQNAGAFFFIDQLSGVDRKSTRLNSSHVSISYADFCWKKK